MILESKHHQCIRMKMGETVWVTRGALTNIVYWAIGTLLGNKVSAYWYTDTVNFGDLLTPLLLRYYGLNPVHSSPERAEVVSTGSILEHVPEDYGGYILGSGLIFDRERLLDKATVLAVRGELTRERIGAPKGVPLGDPGLLVPKLLTQRPAKTHVLGLVPHLSDSTDPRIASIKNRCGKDVLVIEVRRRPIQVLNDIAACEYILSSSLHGVVCADAFGIPNRWLLLSDKVEGKGFKFADYGTALGIHPEPLMLSGNEHINELVKYCRKPPDAVSEVVGGLDAAFQMFRERVIRCPHGR
jgi:pyruvyltransferase